MDLRQAIVFRCDGDDRVGAGHVGRCLPIARACLAAGRAVVFAGAFSGVAAGLLEDAGIPTIAAAGGEPGGIPGDAGAAIVDRYGVSPEELRDAGATRPLLAFRDAGRPTGAGVRELDYHLDADEGFLSGPDYAPLDPAFVAARRSARSGPGLVVLGGSVTGAAQIPDLVEALAAKVAGAPMVAGSVEVPPGAQALGPLRGLSGVFGDIGMVVCGAGVTAYEAACAGVPAVLVVLADNQERVRDAFAGVAPVLDGRSALGRSELGAAIEAALAGDLPECGPALVDGYGAHRVRDALLALEQGRDPASPVRYRPARHADLDLLLEWRNAPEVRDASISPDVIAPDEHARWLSRVLSDDGRALLVAEHEGTARGVLRFDGVQGGEAHVSITVAPEARGRGLGTRMIREATELQFAARAGLRRVVAEVKASNSGSLQAFRNAGYVLGEESEARCLLEALR